MSSSVNFTHVGWATPDGRALFSDLNLSFGSCRTGLVGRNGVGKTTLLKLISGELRPQSGKVIVAGSCALLRQTVQVKPLETVAKLFGVAEELARLRRAERGDVTVEELAEMDWSLEGRILSALGRVGLDAQPDTDLHEMSGGERTRASLAAVLFADPEFLLLDEPTNNLDREGRTSLLHFLTGWSRGAIAVSHDRELLETMDAIVELTSLGATTYGGNWSQYRERKALELEAAKRDLANAEKRLTELARSAQATAERKARKDRRRPAQRREGRHSSDHSGWIERAERRHQRRECENVRTPARGRHGHRGRRARTNRNPRTVLGRASIDRVAQRQERPADGGCFLWL